MTPERGVTTVNGLLTGWHEPVPSHLQMLVRWPVPTCSLPLTLRRYVLGTAGTSLATSI
ncbi:MAG: hypothetical protein ACRDTH_28760 [Pseudonocardiaceae bacterium]